MRYYAKFDVLSNCSILSHIIYFNPTRAIPAFYSFIIKRELGHWKETRIHWWPKKFCLKNGSHILMGIQCQVFMWSEGFSRNLYSEHEGTSQAKSDVKVPLERDRPLNHIYGRRYQISSVFGQNPPNNSMWSSVYVFCNYIYGFIRQNSCHVNTNLSRICYEKLYPILENHSWSRRKMTKIKIVVNIQDQ